MPGGNLLIEIRNNEEIFMTGPVEGVFEGRFHTDFERRLST
jgi:diaminopimelate epimerase